MRRITKAALGGLAGCALALGGTGVASGDLLDILRILEDARDTHTGTVALDDAHAKITIDKATNSTTFSVRVTGIDVSDFSEPVTLGSHLHTGECVKHDFGGPSGSPIPGWQAGPHYNHEVALGKPAVSPLTDTEVWFDLVPDKEGMAYDETTVQFVPIDSDGVMAVVVHVLPTNTTSGAAGTRQACFPVKVSQLFPERPSSTPAE